MPSESVPGYLLDPSGQLAVDDPSDPDKRAGRLLELLAASPPPDSGANDSGANESGATGSAAEYDDDFDAEYDDDFDAEYDDVCDDDELWLEVR
jgi:hypothetical protein